MSSARSNKRQRSGRGAGASPRPGTGARTARTFSLLLLVGVVVVVALQMAVSLARFVLDPDPTVKAGPMYVTLALTTGAALLMVAMALNASFLPFISRRQAPNVYLVMFAMGISGIVTGLLTVGAQASPLVARLVLGAIALTFITLQNVRLTKAREAAPAAPAAASPARDEPRPRSRQRRGGRKN